MRRCSTSLLSHQGNAKQNHFIVTVIVYAQNPAYLFCDPMDFSLPEEPGGLQAMDFPGKNTGVPFPSSGDLLDVGIEPASPTSSTLQADSLPLSHQARPQLAYDCGIPFLGI